MPPRPDFAPRVDGPRDERIASTTSRRRRTARWDGMSGPEKRHREPDQPHEGVMTVLSPLRPVITANRWPGGWVWIRAVFAYTNLIERLRGRRPGPPMPPTQVRGSVGTRVRGMAFIH